MRSLAFTFTLLLALFPIWHTSSAQTSIGGGVGTGHGIAGGNVQIGNLRGSVGIGQNDGTWWEVAYVSIPQDTTGVFYWKIGGGPVAYTTRSVGGEQQSKTVYYGGSGMLMYNVSLGGTSFLNLGAGVSVAEEKVPLFDSQVFPALEATLNFRL